MRALRDQRTQAKPKYKLRVWHDRRRCRLPMRADTMRERDPTNKRLAAWCRKVSEGITLDIHKGSRLWGKRYFPNASTSSKLAGPLGRLLPSVLRTRSVFQKMNEPIRRKGRGPVEYEKKFSAENLQTPNIPKGQMPQKTTSRMVPAKGSFAPIAST